MNMQKYGQQDPRVIDLKDVQKAGVPIAMISGLHDRIVYPADSQWVRDNLGSSLVDYVEVNGGHTVFFLGKDMSFV
jgi:predicted esterase